MYKLKEWWLLIDNKLPIDNWDGKLFCIETDAKMTFRTNDTQGFLECYTFTLVTKGSLLMNYNGNEIMLHAGDLYIYSPGLRIKIIDISEDYNAICLMVDEHATLATPAVRDLVSTANMFIVQLSIPKLSLSKDTAALFEARMREIIRYFYSDNIYKEQVLNMLFAVFLLDIQNVQDHALSEKKVPKRVEEIFFGFNRLLPEYFVEHHDIAFYANKLNITPDYLSRIVKRVTGRTVMDYINQMLVMEASFLLHSSYLTVTQISERLNFADKASFSKFFSRMMGMSPKMYRDGKSSSKTIPSKHDV